MRKVVRPIVIAIAVLLGLPAVLFLASRWRGAPPEQRAALAVMRAPSVMPGENAFAALWLLRYDVPEARQAAVAAEDVQRFQGRALPGGGTPLGPFRSVAAGRFDDLLAAREDGLELCGDECLARVREDINAHAGWMTRQSRLVERVAALARYGHYSTGFEARMDMPFPDVGAVSRVHTAHAVAFAQGRRDEALAGVCRDAGTWRRLMPNSDSLLVSMVAISLYDRSLRLFADMLAELPPGHPVAGSCHAAFAAPLPADSTMCTAMKGEFEFSQAATRHLAENEQASLFFDAEMTAARHAQGMARACDANVAAPPRRRAAPEQPWWTAMMQFECLSNFAGCVLADIAVPAYDDYLRRGEDHAVRMHAGATLVRMHERHPGSAMPQPGLHRALRVEAASQSLVFGLGGRADSKMQRLPLPSSRVESARAAGASTQVAAAPLTAPARSTLR